MARRTSTPKKVARKLVAAWVLIPGAVFMLIVGIVLFATMPRHAVKLSAEITDINYYRNSDGDLKGKVFVDYELDGTDYHHIYLNEYSSSFHEGKIITIYCNSEEPTKIASSARLIAGSVIIAIGLVLLVAGLAEVISNYSKIKVREPIDNILEDFGADQSYQNGVSHPLEESQHQEAPSNSSDSIYTYTSTKDKKKRRDDSLGLIDDPFGK